MKGIPEGITLREGTYDRLIWESVYVNNEYRLPDMFEPGDIVIDIGAHTGAFTVACAMRAAHVYSYEPDANNFDLLKKNAQPFSLPNNFTPYYHAAVWRDDDTYRQFLEHSGYVHPGNGQINTGGGSITSGMGVLVPSKRLCDVIENALRQTRVGTMHSREDIRLIKFDCEGSEFPILLHAKDLSKVQEIVGEFHEGYGHKKEELVTCLEGHGFTVTTDGPTSEGLGHFWARR